jgi:hypothetical protein
MAVPPSNRLGLVRAAAIIAVSLAAPAPGRAAVLLVPAYFSPDANPGISQWSELIATARSGVPIDAIINANNGPGGAFDPNYATVVAAMQAAGAKVFGYIYTCYGGATCGPGLPATRSVSEILAQAQTYAQWYKVDGIFLDEVSNQSSALGYYSTVAQGLRALRPNWQIVGNPGTGVPPEYLGVADTLVTYESGTGSFAAAITEPWMLTADPTRQAALLYDVPAEARMDALLAAATGRGAGYIYVTDATVPNPWDRLPAYWTQEAAAVVADVPEPASAAVTLSGLALLAGLRRRRRRSGRTNH